MRFFSVILYILAISIWMGGCKSGDLPEKPASISPLEVRIYEIYGKDCMECYTSLAKFANALGPVQEAQTDWQAKQLTVFVRPDAVLDDESVYDVIRCASFAPVKRLE